MKKEGLQDKGGLVNGLSTRMDNQGIINGNAIVPSQPKKEGGLNKILVTMIILMLVAVGIGGFVASSYMKNVVSWGAEKKFIDVDVENVGLSAVNITAFGALQVDGTFNFYIRFAGGFADLKSGYAYILVDDDSNPSTGYNAGYLGAEYMIKIQVNSGSLSGELYSFNGTSTEIWSWKPVKNVYVGSEIPTEIAGYFEGSFSSDATFIMLAKSSYYQDITPVFRPGKPAVVALQKQLDNDTLEITLFPIYSAVEVQGINVEKTGNVEVTTNPYVGGLLDRPKRIYVSVRAENNYTGGARVWLSEMLTNATVTIMGNDFEKYYGTPDKIEIDGFFEDWNTIAPPIKIGSGNVENKNIDITEYSAYQDDSTYFYLSVAGVMLKGNIAPEMPGETGAGTPGEGGGVEVIKRPYDYAQIEFTTESGAKHTIEIYGYMGIVHRILLDGKETNRVRVAVGRNHGYGALEVGFDSSDSVTSYTIRMTDWNGESDYVSAHYLPRSDDNRTAPPDIYAPEFNQILPILLIIVAIPIIRKRRK